MPLTDLTFSVLVKWRLALQLAGFNNRVQDDDGQQFNLAALDLTKFNQLRADNYNIPVGGSFDFDLFSFVDLDGVSTGFVNFGVIAVAIKPVVGKILVAPSPSNGLNWPVTNSTPVSAGGVFPFSEPPTGPAIPVTALSRNIRITNNDAVAATGYFIAIGG